MARMKIEKVWGFTSRGQEDSPGLTISRLQSAASVEAKDEEAACAEEAFDFPRFVVPLFGEEVWKPICFYICFIIGM